MASEKQLREPCSPDPPPLEFDGLDRDAAIHEHDLDATPKSRWERSWPVFACGAGLFSDGYLNGVRVDLRD